VPARCVALSLEYRQVANSLSGDDEGGGDRQ
jgi:hypothetical protein